MADNDQAIARKAITIGYNLHINIISMVLKVLFI